MCCFYAGVVGRMQPWSVEHVSLWVWDASNGLPPPCEARVKVKFEEVGIADIDDLSAAMNQATSEKVRRRLQSKRRCFSLRVAGQIVAYGWLTRGAERVGELERQLRLQDEEAYIWDCATVPVWRRQHCYSALLNHLIYQLHAEGVPRIWIATARHNQPSVRGIVNAGFRSVVDLTYRRFYRLTWLWIHQVPSTRCPFVSLAYRMLRDEHERRFGQLLMGYKRKLNEENHA